MRKLLLLALGLAALEGQAPAPDHLKDLFRDPPREYSIEPLWSWNSALERDKLIWQIDQMVEQGVYGAYMHARDGLDQSRTPYFSEGFWDGVKTSVEHGEKVGFRTWIYDEDKWPSGDAGGRIRAANPERYTAMGLRHRFQDVRGPGKVALQFPGAKFVIAARKVSENRIDSTTLTDLTGRSEWQVPEGQWRISILVPAWRPVPLPNYLNPDAVKEFIHNTYEQYASRVSRHFGKTIPGSFFDEIFNITLAWDPLLEERFRAAKGYELRKVLPLLFEDGGPETIKVRCDYFEEFTKLYADAWFRQLADWCGRHNLKLTGHTNEELYDIYNQGDYFRTWRLAQKPGTDNEDFRYTWPRVIGSWKPKQLSSVTHVYGKPRAMVEALGGAGWTVTLDQARYGVNMLAVYGINSFVFHLFHYAQDTRESMDDWPNSWFYQNPYWKYFKKLADYTRRLSFMGSQGEHVAGIAVLYPVEEVWSRGIVRQPPAEPPVVALVDRLAREQLDCDLVDTDSLIRSVSGAEGRAKIGAESYRVLVLPEVRTVSLAAYRRIAELAATGLKVVALGTAPRHSAEHGADDPEVLRISEKLFPAGALDREELIRWLRSAMPPDVLVEQGDGPALRYYHRRVGDKQVYFLANSERRPVSARIRFAAEGAAEKWNPETGQSAPLPAGSALNLEFQPWEAYFVVFDRAARSGAAPEQAPATTVELGGPWTFQMAPAELDYTWKPDPGETRGEVPVAEFRLEKEDRPWRKIKVADPLNPVEGAARYLSAWDAAWITRYFYAGRHPGELAGRDLRFSKELDVPFEPESARLAVVADGAVECEWNGTQIASGRGSVSLEKLPVVAGRNRMECAVRGRGYLLAQGEIRGPNGRRVEIRSGADWTVSAPGKPPLPAYEFAFPPFGRWGEPNLSNAGKLLPAAGGKIVLPEGSFLRLKVDLTEASDGLLKPLVFHCSKARGRLGDWRELGLDWYSGRGVYSTSFQLPAAPAGRTLTLDLGELCYTGEVWLNGRLMGTLAWPPNRVDITGATRAGSNELVIVAANLLANQMRWNLFDAAISRPMSRWWHDGNILRDTDKLRSGLIGPVRIEIR
ncbi:MAG: glycosyl hydrolase [Bryobacteraceae bacterium]|jgi:hypothetical protein